MQKLWTALFATILALLGVWFSHSWIGLAEKISDTTVKLSITNAFVWTNSFVDSFFSSWWVLYTNQPIHDINVWATATSTYTVSWDIVTPLSWSGTGTYTSNETITLEWPDWLKILQTDFVSPAGERVQANPLEVYLDTQAPTVPVLLWPTPGSSQSWWWILFTWNNSTDWASGVQEYELIVSTSPAMLSPITFTTTQNSLLVNKNLLPLGDLYWFVKAKDNVWNESVAVPSYFVHEKGTTTWKTSSITSGSWNWSNGNNDDDDIVIWNTLYEKPDTDDKWLTYVFTYYDDETVDEEKTGIIDIIKEQNRLQILVNNKKDERMHSVADNEEIIWEQSNTFNSLTLPQYLQQTGVDIWELQYHLSLIAKYFPNETIKNELMKVISSLNLWHWGVVLFLILLCYDVETWSNRIKTRKK